jgi:hypothetical protein
MMMNLHLHHLVHHLVEGYAVVVLPEVENNVSNVVQIAAAGAAAAGGKINSI